MRIKGSLLFDNPVLQRLEPKRAEMAQRLQGVLHSRGADLQRVAADHGLTPEKFKHTVEATIQRLLGVEGPLGEQHGDPQRAVLNLQQPFDKRVLPTASKDWKSSIPQRSPEEWKRLGAQMAKDIQYVQDTFAKKECRDPMRGQHAGPVLSLTDAKTRIRPDLPDELKHGIFAQSELRTLVRFSNAPSSLVGDGKVARRGIALRFSDDKGHSQDLLLTTGSPAFLAKDGPSAVAAAKAEADGIRGFIGLADKIGAKDTARLIFAAKTTDAKDESLAASTFFSRVPYQLGDYAVKFRMTPVKDEPQLWTPKCDRQLTRDMQARLKNGPVKYVLEAQFVRNPADMADARIDWDSPYVSLGEVELPQQDLSDLQVQSANDEINKLSFKPWNRWDDDDRAMLPVGDVNMARKYVYEASSTHRGSGPENNHRCPLGYG